jgi:acyl carrier protein
MTEAEIYAGLTELFREVFDDDDIVLTPTTTAQDINGWDSQAHVNLIVAAEMRFGIRFRAAELDCLHNVGDFAKLVAEKAK